MSAEQPIESADALSPFSDGTLIEDRFKIVGEVGRGGMSTVYEALHTITGKRLAIKVISEKLSADAAYHQRFLREAKLMAQMKHPAIAAVHAVGNYHGRLYIVMDFIEGTSLLDELSKGAMPEARACQIAIQVCEALAHAHAKGIIHRDLKPGNIMLERTESGDQIKLVDFGIAGWLDRDDTGRITQTGEVFGSPYFMSPEQAQGMRLDGRSDIYSLGCIMYQMLSGELPFSGGSMYEVLAKQMQSDPPPLKNVSSSWQKVVQAALAKNPDDRYQSATALREDLAKTAAGAPVKPRKPQTLRKGKLPTPIAICAALLFIAAAGVAIIQLALQIKIDRESLQAVVPVLSPEERDPAQVEDISGEIEAKSMLFVGRDKEATLPEHQRALEVMKSRTQLKNHDPEKGRRIDAAVDLLRKAIASKQGSTAERALMLHRLAVWDAILCHRGRDRTRQLAMYEEAMDSLKHAEALYNEVKPGFSTSYRKYHTLAFINWQFGRTAYDVAALNKAEVAYSKGAKLLADKKTRNGLDSEEQLVLQKALSRLTQVQELKKNYRDAAVAGVDPNSDWSNYKQFARDMLTIDGKDAMTLPGHIQAMKMFEQAARDDISIKDKRDLLEDAKHVLRKSAEECDEEKVGPTELALMRLRLGMAEIHVAALETDFSRRNQLFSRANTHVTEGVEMYNAVKPGYSKTAQALIRRGYVNHKYGEMSGDLEAYNQARNYYVQAQNKLQEKEWQGGLTADERRMLDILKQRVADIDHKVAHPDFVPGETGY